MGFLNWDGWIFGAYIFAMIPPLHTHPLVLDRSSFFFFSLLSFFLFLAWLELARSLPWQQGVGGIIHTSVWA